MLQTLKLNNEKWKKIFVLQRKKFGRIDSRFCLQVQFTITLLFHLPTLIQARIKIQFSITTIIIKNMKFNIKLFLKYLCAVKLSYNEQLEDWPFLFVITSLVIAGLISVIK